MTIKLGDKVKCTITGFAGTATQLRLAQHARHSGTLDMCRSSAS